MFFRGQSGPCFTSFFDPLTEDICLLAAGSKVYQDVARKTLTTDFRVGFHSLVKYQCYRLPLDRRRNLPNTSQVISSLYIKLFPVHKLFRLQTRMDFLPIFRLQNSGSGRCVCVWPSVGLVYLLHRHQPSRAAA